MRLGARRLFEIVEGPHTTGYCMQIAVVIEIDQGNGTTAATSNTLQSKGQLFPFHSSRKMKGRTASHWRVVPQATPNPSAFISGAARGFCTVMRSDRGGGSPSSPRGGEAPSTPP